MKRTIFLGSIGVLIIIFLSFLYILFKTFSRETLDVLFSLKRRYLLLSFLWVFLLHTFDNLRLFILSRAVGVKYSFLYGYAVSLANTFAATVTPAHIGGEAMAIYLIARKGVSIPKTMSIVTMKTISGMSFFILALPVTVMYLMDNKEIAYDILKLLGGVFILTGIVYIAFIRFFKKNQHLREDFITSLKRAVLRYYITLKIYALRRRKVLLLAVLYSSLLYISFLMIAPTLLKAFGSDQSFIDLAYQQLGLLYAIFISPTPGGSGVGEIGALSTFSAFLPVYQLGVFAILWRLISQYMSALLGGIILFVFLYIDSKRYGK